MLLLAAASRDPEKFTAPDRFDIRRKTMGHVGFGFGIHMCVGQMLSTLEAEVLLEEMLPRIEKIERASRSGASTTCCAACSLPIRFTIA
jgi:cytochrome P450